MYVRKTERICTCLAFFTRKTIRPRLQAGPYVKPPKPYALAQADQMKSRSTAIGRRSRAQTPKLGRHA